MTEPPAAPPPPDPTADPPPFSTPYSPPYPAGGGGYPTYLPGSAPVEPRPVDPPTYPPVTAVPAYGQDRPARSGRLGIGLAVTLALAIGGCGVIGIASFVLLSNNRSGSTSQPVAVEPSQAPTEAPGQAVPTDPPSSVPFGGAPDDTPHDIVYEVTGAADTAAVAYLDADDASVKTEQVNLPWRREIKPGTGIVATTLTAFSPSGETVSCRITVDGQQVDADAGKGMVVCVGLVR
jgi:hypothetical protein